MICFIFGRCFTEGATLKKNGCFTEGLFEEKEKMERSVGNFMVFLKILGKVLDFLSKLKLNYAIMGKLRMLTLNTCDKRV